MSGSLTLAMRTAQSGLLSNQEALNAVSNNIANVNTPGYSRKVVNMEQRVVGGVGAGVQVADITRKVDEGLIKSMRLEMSTLNELSVQDPYFQRVQELFGRPQDNTSLSHLTTQYNNAVEELALDPTNTINQNNVMTQARQLTLMVNRMSETIQELRLQADSEIETATNRIGTLLTSVHTINNQLVANTAVNVDVTDLRDQRDVALDELSTLIDIRYYYRGDGDAVVFTEGGRTLVDNTPISISHVAASAVSSTTNHSEGDLNAIYVGDKISTNDITNEIRNGRIKGLIDLRDTTLPNMQSQIDEFSVQLRDQVNIIHNTGTSFPGRRSMTGTREFLDGANQTITFSGTEDTTLSLFDGTGNQTATTTVRTLLGGATGSIDTVASTMQTWLRANGAAGATATIDSAGHFAINLNATTPNLVMRDQTATTSGSTVQDATISFKSNAGRTETVTGFSNFMGLNDFFIDDKIDNIHDSAILSTTYGLGTTTTLSFYNAASTTAATIGGATVNITAGMTLDQIVTAINDTASVGVTASKVPDGSGFRLRLSESSGLGMTVSDSANTFITEVGLEVSKTQSSGLLKVRDDIVSTPGNIARGIMQWDATKGAAGEYFTSTNDDTAIQAMTVQLSQTHQFTETGGLSSLKVTLTSFSSSIIGYNATLANDNQSLLSYQQTLTDSLTAKSDNFRGVNMDEEMTQLMLFQQAYSAAARIISTVQRMFDALENIV